MPTDKYPTAEVIVLPEAAITGYDEGAILRAMAEGDGETVREAEAVIAEACRTHKLAAIVGTPYYDETTGAVYNSATVIGPDGRVAGRQHKLQLVSTDVVSGEGWWWGRHLVGANWRHPHCPFVRTPHCPYPHASIALHHHTSHH
jgi:predicted amidohydrolase